MDHFEDTPDVNSWTISVPDCVVCDDRGCEFCAKAPEPWPSEAFKSFGTVDLQTLILAAQKELYRKERASWSGRNV